MKATIDFFDNYLNEFDAFISDVVLAEIKRTPDAQKRDLLMSTIEKYKLRIYNNLTEEIESMATGYIDKGIIPVKKIDDALHIAFATYYEFDILLSWNFKHLSNIKKQKEINIVNLNNGYCKPLVLINPLEVIYEK
ncbi:MAG TPA: type II toxin-antitoxin system VapC family toxin [Candidatus Wallbacteria bacterium]|nr:type II toxin-antitoxin system VapC family toxin [Candidatus Wallbacteria bacterium]